MSYMQGVIFVNKPSDIPKEDHFAIIDSNSVYIPGDERSRTNPGHGYPASTEYFIIYRAFLKKDDLMLYLEKENPEKRKNFRILKIQSINLVETLSLSIEE